jgi:hypothetical protein
MRGFHLSMELNVHIKQYKQLQTQSNRTASLAGRVAQRNLIYQETELHCVNHKTSFCKIYPHIY